MAKLSKMPPGTASSHGVGLPKKLKKYLTKGKEVMVKGKLINRNYTDKDGNKKYVTEVEIDDFYMLGRNAEVVG
ncbi:MAG: single-stranded DNA-binding protein [Methylotenera sp.]